VVQAANDKLQLEPMLGKIGALPDELGAPETLLADAGYFSAANVAACAAAEIEPLIAMRRRPHHPPLAERLKKAPSAPHDPTPVEAIAYGLKTPVGRKLYAQREHNTPEPVFGIVKSALGFRQFSLRGLDKVRGEWHLVTMAWNVSGCLPSPSPEQPLRSQVRHENKDLAQPVDTGDHAAVRERQSARQAAQTQNRPRRSAPNLCPTGC
jgi:hypothetical protein